MVIGQSHPQAALEAATRRASSIAHPASTHLLIYSSASPARTFAQGGSKNVLKKCSFLRTFAQNVRTFVYFVQLLFIFVQLFTATCANGSKTCAFVREFLRICE